MSVPCTASWGSAHIAGHSLVGARPFPGVLAILARSWGEVLLPQKGQGMAWGSYPMWGGGEDVHLYLKLPGAKPFSALAVRLERVSALIPLSTPFPSWGAGPGSPRFFWTIMVQLG